MLTVRCGLPWANLGVDMIAHKQKTDTHVQDAPDDVEAVAVRGMQDQHHLLDGDPEDGLNPAAIKPRVAPLDPDPLMRAAAELLAENASLLAQRNSTA